MTLIQKIFSRFSPRKAEAGHPADLLSLPDLAAMDGRMLADLPLWPACGLQAAYEAKRSASAP